MKKTITLFVALYFSLSFGEGWGEVAFGQNLVPNPSFEDTIDCYSPKFWTSFGNSPDYYNPCRNSIFMGTPVNGAGYQYPSNGNSYFGLFTYLNIISNQREFIGVKLIDILKPNVKYYISFKINLANMSNVAANKIGVLFSTKKYNDTLIAPINNHSNFFTNSIIVDTTNWIKVSGSFISDSAYSYVCIGNFFNDINTSVTVLSSSGTGAYYLIDEVCVSNDSLVCNLNTGLEQSKFYEPKIIVFPNPTQQRIQISGITNFSSRLVDITGKEIKKFRNSNEMEISEIENGVYILAIDTKTETIFRKIIIIH